MGPGGRLRAMFISAIDMTIVNVALPDISEDLNAGIGELQWVLDAFLVSLAGLLLVGSGLADRFGRRRVFLRGMAGFARRVRAGAPRPTGRADRRAGADGRGGRVRAAAGAVADRGACSRPRSARRRSACGRRSRARAGARAGAGRRAGRRVGWQAVFLVNVPVASWSLPGRAARCCRSRAGRGRLRSTSPGAALSIAGAGRHRVRADRGRRRRMDEPRRDPGA